MAGVSRVPYEGVTPADMRVDPVGLGGSPGPVFTARGRIISAVPFAFDDQGRTRGIDNVAHPDKQRAVANP